jgi:hypothetical protein
MSKLIVDVAGFKELESKIKQLANDKDKKREMILILRQVAKPTVAAARQTAPRSKKEHTISGGTRAKKTIQPGNLSKSIGDIVGKKGGSRINPTVYVGPRARGTYDGFYGAWVHEGHNIYAKGFKRKRKKGANNAFAKSKTKANQFMDRAYAQTQGRVTTDAEKRTAAFIQRRINKLSNA